MFIFSIIELVKKDFKIDFRQKYPLAGILLYTISIVYIIYLGFQGILSPLLWNTLVWLALLFTSVTGLAKSFILENNRAYYYYFLVPPHQILIAKLVYNLIFQLFLLLILLGVFYIWLGWPKVNFYLLMAQYGCGSVGLAAVFTLVSALSAKSDQPGALMPILGFPVAIPVLVLGIGNSRRILNGDTWDLIAGNTYSLLSLIVIIIAVSFILFPYTWKS